MTDLRRAKGKETGKCSHKCRWVSIIEKVLILYLVGALVIIIFMWGN